MAENIDSSELWKVENDSGNNNNNNNLNSYFICNVCRLCANISNNVVPIFDKPTEKGSIYNKMKKCLPSIVVFENDMKPKQICLSCISKLDLCVSFMDMSREADCKFEVLLQNKAIPQTNLNEPSINGRILSNDQEISWISEKQENLAALQTENESNKCKEQVDLTSTLLDQLYRQRTFSQQVISTPVSVSTTQNCCSSHTQNGVSHSILQNLLTQDTVSPQDVVVLVEVKCKDVVTASNNAVINRKPELPQNVVVPSVKIEPIYETENNLNQQTKIVDTNGHIRVINLSDFEGKFNQFDKIASSFVTTDNVAPVEKSLSTSNGIVPFLKSFESDVLNMLKLENFSSDNSPTPSTDASKSALTTSIATSSVPATMISGNTKQNSTTVREFRCEICAKQFTRKNRLNAHVARHSSERPHPCDKCDQRFITRWDLTLHLRIHSGIFSCEFCGKAFPAKGKLERHRRTHTGERPFPCTTCNRAFSEKRNLKNHLKTHSSTAADSRKSPNSSCTLCGGWLMSINDDDSTKATCNSCNSQNDNVDVTDASNASEIKDVTD